MSSRKLAIVTGASSGIGLEIAKLAAKDGYDLIVAADTPFVEAGPALKELRRRRPARSKRTSRRSRASTSCCPQSAAGRSTCSSPMPGHGLGHGFLDQSPDEWQHVINTDITGTLLLIQPIVKRMVERGEGRVLITGSIAGHLAGAFQAVYNGSKAFIDSFSAALNEEIKDSGVTVTCLKPGATETNFFHRAELDDTKVGQAKKDDPADVAKAGWDAMKKRRAGGHLRPQEQDAGRRGRRDDRRDDGQAPPRPGRAGQRRASSASRNRFGAACARRAWPTTSQSDRADIRPPRADRHRPRGASRCCVAVADRPRPAVRSGGGGTIIRAISEPLIEASAPAGRSGGAGCGLAPGRGPRRCRLAASASRSPRRPTPWRRRCRGRSACRPMARRHRSVAPVPDLVRAAAPQRRARWSRASEAGSRPEASASRTS